MKAYDRPKSTTRLWSSLALSETIAHERAERRYVALLDELRTLPSEAPWAEFKSNNRDPERIGRTMSALANSARLADKPFGYMAWGIEDTSHAVIGSSFDPSVERKGSEPLEFWLAKMLDPSPAFTFRAVAHPAGRVMLLEIPAASSAPVQFNGRAFIRIGETTPPLSDYRDRERLLWTKLQPLMWEDGIAVSFADSDEILQLIDYPAYFQLTEQRLPDNRVGILDGMARDRLIEQDVGSRWKVANLGAILFANDLSRFENLGRKAVRVIQYAGNSRAEQAREVGDRKGYANGFSGVVAAIDSLLPRNEHVEKILRVERPVYPEIAVRELVANALIHQDMTVRGTGPTIEIYSDRIEITNPGTPLVDITKFIGAPPRSRNEAMAALMRRMNMCEERGQGIVKVVTSAEIYQLPPPDFRASESNFQVALFAPRTFSDMDAAERLRACYQHAALKYVTGSRMTNASLRDRFGIMEQNAAQVSRIIKDALKLQLIRPADASRPRAGYVPTWGTNDI